MFHLTSIIESSVTSPQVQRNSTPTAGHASFTVFGDAQIPKESRFGGATFSQHLEYFLE